MGPWLSCRAPAGLGFSGTPLAAAAHPGSTCCQAGQEAPHHSRCPLLGMLAHNLGHLPHGVERGPASSPATRSGPIKPGVPRAGRALAASYHHTPPVPPLQQLLSPDPVE